ncbi:MAG: hypothetical protein J3K34DRAFT_73745 [Monoraphidium minutum]|nr:MAG: hypothetical protein J3K34DRAFT_73745 [Monoraphidium minutum]
MDGVAKRGGEWRSRQQGLNLGAGLDSRIEVGPQPPPRGDASLDVAPSDKGDQCGALWRGAAPLGEEGGQHARPRACCVLLYAESEGSRLAAGLWAPQLATGPIERCLLCRGHQRGLGGVLSRGAAPRAGNPDKNLVHLRHAENHAIAGAGGGVDPNTLSLPVCPPLRQPPAPRCCRCPSTATRTAPPLRHAAAAAAAAAPLPPLPCAGQQARPGAPPSHDSYPAL